MSHVASAMNLRTNSTGLKKMEILNLEKWHSQTRESVRRVLDNANAPCVGFCLLFMEMLDNEAINWKFKPMLAFDPHNPPPKEDRERLEEIFTRWAELAQLIMSGGEDARKS